MIDTPSMFTLSGSRDDSGPEPTTSEEPTDTKTQAVRLIKMATRGGLVCMSAVLMCRVSHGSLQAFDSAHIRVGRGWCRELTLVTHFFALAAAFGVIIVDDDGCRFSMTRWMIAPSVKVKFWNSGPRGLVPARPRNCWQFLGCTPKRWMSKGHGRTGQRPSLGQREARNPTAA